MSVAERLRGVRRLLREATGEAKWDDYLTGCQADGSVPISRQEFERHRTDDVGGEGPQRCC